MSRIAKVPVEIPAGVEVTIAPELITVKGKNGQLTQARTGDVEVVQEANVITFTPKGNSRQSHAMSGTLRVLVDNMVVGVTKGFERKLQLVGVGYRAQIKGKHVALTLGFSHPVEHPIPEGITIETPSQTEIVIKGANKQVVGQVAADIRAYRPPEPYKGKGVRYSDERIVRKETKKK